MGEERHGRKSLCKLNRPTLTVAMTIMLHRSVGVGGNQNRRVGGGGVSAVRMGRSDSEMGGVVWCV